jgi:hypothetical protein
MDTRQKEPLMRELVKGSTIIVECHNNKPKHFVHILQCSDEQSTLSQNVKYQFIQEIVNLSTRWEPELIQWLGVSTKGQCGYAWD